MAARVWSVSIIYKLLYQQHFCFTQEECQTHRDHVSISIVKIIWKNGSFRNRENLQYKRRTDSVLLSIESATIFTPSSTVIVRGIILLVSDQYLLKGCIIFIQSLQNNKALLYKVRKRASSSDLEIINRVMALF